MFAAGGYKGPGIESVNNDLKNTPRRSGGGSGNTKDIKCIMEKRRKRKKKLSRITKQARNRNHLKRAA